MREILFRGKGINDKEWRYGFYTEQQGYPYITPDGVAMYEIDANTAGQYTGFVDKMARKYLRAISSVWTTGYPHVCR